MERHTSGVLEEEEETRRSLPPPAIRRSTVADNPPPPLPPETKDTVRPRETARSTSTTGRDREGLREHMKERGLCRKSFAGFGEQSPAETHLLGLDPLGSLATVSFIDANFEFCAGPSSHFRFEGPAARRGGGWGGGRRRGDKTLKWASLPPVGSLSWRRAAGIHRRAVVIGAKRGEEGAGARPCCADRVWAMTPSPAQQQNSGTVGERP
ncbi:hypothetical protein N7462_010477 [Penicillium macrosclerotiorum]|uniref:uncharacterized protein n=1 Tax=Penicillium macrosclerotiorum TaxID=303699 RepID=UPI002547F06B|nr:uncharacterized protein N7462_010477 [Penicillium macrosclerotiorum]KAJ5669407.1 hypothetical protein N7462_010477 [Penicillium macrosclerotiorum]